MGTASTPNGVAFRTTQLTPAIGAVVEGLDLSGQLDDATMQRIRAALDAHLVLFFEHQDLSARAQRDFAARFGPLYVHPVYPGDPDAPEIMVLAHDETRRPHSDRWHTDVTYIETPPEVAVLYSEVIPEIGGDTLWANMYLAYETLSEPMQRFLGELHAVHSFAKNFTPDRFDELAIADRTRDVYSEHPPVLHPIVRTNVATGRKALFVNRDFTVRIDGLREEESDAVLRVLFEHLAQPAFQVRWRWQPGTVAIWDNRWTQHCALADYFPSRRRVRRATVLGERPI